MCRESGTHGSGGGNGTPSNRNHVLCPVYFLRELMQRKEVNPLTKEELEERLLDFAMRIGKLVDALPETRLGRHVAGQLIRCGTSPAPNYAEACAAESVRDFVHKRA